LKQGGFTLIEVLVTFFIISIGLMGLLSLQINTMNHALDAIMRGQATTLVDDLSERIRLMPEDAYQGLLNRPGTLLGLNDTDCSAYEVSTPEFLICEWGQKIYKSNNSDLHTAPQGAVGCIDWSPQRPSNDRYKTIRVQVAWVGQTPTTEAPAQCGVDYIDPEYRRVLWRDINVRNEEWKEVIL